jgi:hypothetical protein
VALSLTLGLPSLAVESALATGQTGIGAFVIAAATLNAVLTGVTADSVEMLEAAAGDLQKDPDAGAAPPASATSDAAAQKDASAAPTSGGADESAPFQAAQAAGFSAEAALQLPSVSAQGAAGNSEPQHDSAGTAGQSQGSKEAAIVIGSQQRPAPGNADLNQAEAVVSGTAGHQDASEQPQSFQPQGLVEPSGVTLLPEAAALPPLSLSLGLHAKRAGVTGSQSQGSQPITATPALFIGFHASPVKLPMGAQHLKHGQVPHDQAQPSPDPAHATTAAAVNPWCQHQQ